MKIQSTPITFIDQTDSRKLETYLKSNLPNIQIYNSNTKTYTPDWRTGEKLILTANIFLDSQEMSTDEYDDTVIKWYKDEISTGTEIVDNRNKKIFTVNNNVLSSNPIITYICQATYQGIVSSTRLTFARVDTGVNGKDGADGTSVKILGTADSVTLVPNTNYYTITYSKGTITAAALGDAYLYQGDLYVCSVLNGSSTTDYFVNVGPIQGEKGQDSKSLVLSGNSKIFKVSKTNATSPSIITVVAQTSNTNVSVWSYSTNGGRTFLSTVPSGVTRNGNIVTVAGPTLSTNSLVIKASDGEIDDVFTICKVYDGADGNTGDPAPFAFLTNENITFSANAQGQVASTTIISNVVAYQGATKVMPSIRKNSDGTLAITGVPSGMSIASSENTVSKEIMLTITISNNSTLGSASNNMGTINIPIISPINTVLALTWSKVNAGTPGVGILSTTVSYGVSDSASVRPSDDSWQLAVPVVADGKYLWTRTIIDYTDTSKPNTIMYTYAKQGEQVDEIVDSGTLNNWSIRKWSSGVAECWCTLTYTLSPHTTINGFSAYEGSVAFPTNFFITQPNVQFQPYIENGFTMPACGATSTNVQCKWAALSNINTANTSIKIDVFAIGKWK